MARVAIQTLSSRKWWQPQIALDLGVIYSPLRVVRLTNTETPRPNHAQPEVWHRAQVLISYRSLFCVNERASRDRSGKQTNAVFKRRRMLRRRRGVSRLFIVSASGYRAADANSGPIRKRCLREAPDLSAFPDATKSSTHLAFFYNWFLLWHSAV